METINIFVQSKKVWLNFYGSDFFFALKIILAIYIAVLIVDIILIIVIHTPGMYLRVIKEGANIPLAHKKKMQKRWARVKERLESGNASQYKAAVLEADEIVNDVLAKIGYPGDNMGERLDNITLDQLETIDELKVAHTTRNEIVRKADFALDQKRAEELVGVYQKTLETVDFL